MKINLTINGKKYSPDVEPRLLLIHYLRDVAGLTGSHIGCETSLCGACTVELDGKAVKSCSMFAVQADGASLTTIEGLAAERKAARDAGSLLESARRAMRFLYARHDHGVQTDSGPQREPDRRRDPSWHRRQPMPLHRVSAHRQRSESRGRSGGQVSGDRETDMASTITQVEKLVGKRIRRREDPRLITGTATYVDDIQMPGMHYAAIVRSPHAAARIRSIDTKAAARNAQRRGDLHRQGHGEGWAGAVRRIAAGAARPASLHSGDGSRVLRGSSGGGGGGDRQVSGARCRGEDRNRLGRAAGRGRSREGDRRGRAAGASGVAR